MNEVICEICFRHCHIQEGHTGFCRARKNEGGRNVPDNYGRLTGLALDPIEKKPLARFYPGSWILSCGSYGCNLACPFCQNHEISMADETNAGYRYYSPDQLARLILNTEDNLGIAFTYNEPMICPEYILDVAALIRPHGKKVVLVTNGCVTRKTAELLAPAVDAANIDLKGDRAFYEELSGSYDAARETIAFLQEHCHVEITSLIIPGKNDSEEWVRKESEWIASLDPEIPLHLTRYFPRYRYTIRATDPETILRLVKIAKQSLSHVYAGNMPAWYAEEDG